MSKPRKKYRPKYTQDQILSASQNALFARSAEGIDPESLGCVFQSLWLALDAMKTGKATHKDYNILSSAANISTVLCERGIGREYVDICASALKELAHARSRHTKTGHYGLSGTGARVIGEMIEVREAQLSADGYTAGMDYQAAQVVCERLRTGVVQAIPE